MFETEFSNYLLLLLKIDVIDLVKDSLLYKYSD